jgi:D-glycero-D-manno-heptose 1,7-bisphosphate phosphatase
MNLSPALFLDRDGVLIEEVEYLAKLELVKLIPGASAVVRRANDAGWRVVVVSNQSGVARGLLPESLLPEVHREIARQLLEESGATIDGFYYCPHHPTEGQASYRIACDCRKPKPGMLLRAARELGIDFAQSWMIGDRRTDLEAGAAAGCRTILVRTGYGASTGIDGPDAELNLAAVVPSIVEAVAIIGL